VLGGDTGVNGNLVNALVEFVVGQLVQFDSCDGHVVVRSNTEFARYRRRGVRVVARNHHYAYPGGTAFRHGILRFRARGVIHARETDKHKVALDFFRREPRR
jgi:hypothetical protein